MGRKCQCCIDTLFALVKHLSDAKGFALKGERDKALLLQRDAIIDLKTLREEGCIKPETVEPALELLEKDHAKGVVSPGTIQTVLSSLHFDSAIDIARVCQRE